MVCPAYQSAFVLDKGEQQDLYSLFTVVAGDTVPKRPFGFRYEADGDSLMEKFINGTPGPGFRVQGGRTHSFEKAGFTYENRKKEPLLARVFRGKEKPVLENPYLFDRLTKKRPFYKLDRLEMDLIHFNGPAYDSLVRATVNSGDSTLYDALMAQMDSLPYAIQQQYAPLLSRGFNVEQEAYNKRFAEYFPKLGSAEEEVVDSTTLKDFLSDTLSSDSIAKKKGLFGLFKKKNKVPKPKKRKSKNNNAEATKGEDNE